MNTPTDFSVFKGNLVEQQSNQPLLYQISTSPVHGQADNESFS